MNDNFAGGWYATSSPIVTANFYPYAPGSYGTSIAEALKGEVKLAGEPKIPATKFIQGSGLSFNTIPGRLRFLRDDQRERAERTCDQI